MAIILKTTSTWLDIKNIKANFYLDLMIIFFYFLGALYVIYMIYILGNTIMYIVGLLVLFLLIWIAVKVFLYLGYKHVRPYVVGSEAEMEIWKILQKLPDNYYISRDPITSETGNIDMVVIGPTGVFAIEVKSNKIKLDVKHNRLAYNGLNSHWGKDFVKQTKRGAGKISDHLQKFGIDNYYVQPVLVFTNARGLRLGKNKLDGTYIVRKELLNEVIQDNKHWNKQVKIGKLLTCLGH